MDIDFRSVIKNFIKSFVLKEKREQILLILDDSDKRTKFVNTLNHKWESVLDMKLMKSLDPKLIDKDSIKKELQLEDTDLCYVFSNYSDIDGKVMEFDFALNYVYGRGLASILVNLYGNRIFLETEMEQGAPKRFIGIANV